WRRLPDSGTRELGTFTEVLLAAVGADPAGPPPGTPNGTRARLTGSAAVRALRAAYLGLILEVAADDLGHVVCPALPAPSYDEVAAQLSDLADAALRAALA